MDNAVDTEFAHPHHLDAMRVHALHRPEEAKPKVPLGQMGTPHLTYRGGRLLSDVEVVTVFWGAAWTGAQKALAGQLNGFFDYVLTSPLIDQLAEYSTSKYRIGHGKRVGSVNLTSPAPMATTHDHAIQRMLEQEIASNPAFPKPNANTLYFVYAPPGVRIVQGGAASCQAFCGYHNDIGGQILYAVIPYPTCAGCLGGLTVKDALTSVSSHELCEAITDPVPGQGWYDNAHGEIGDICAWRTKQLGGYVVQLEWSNRANRCL